MNRFIEIAESKVAELKDDLKILSQADRLLGEDATKEKKLTILESISHIQDIISQALDETGRSKHEEIERLMQQHG